MNMTSFWNNRLLNSKEAELGAERMIQRMRNKKLGMDILPNSYEQYNGKLEEEDYISYCRFLQSSNGRNLLENLEEQNAGNFVAL
jgi:hypothetical protein